MPRRKKPESIDEQIVLVQADIDKLTEQLNKKKAELANLEAKKDEKEKEVILDLINSSGLGVDELAEVIKNATAKRSEDGTTEEE